MNHLGTTCVGGTSGETVNGACLMSFRANMGSKMHASQSCQPAPQPWCQLQESSDLKQGLTLLEVLCFFPFLFFFLRKSELIFLSCLTHEVVLRIK